VDGAYRRAGADVRPAGNLEAECRTAVDDHLRHLDVVEQLVVLKTDTGQAQPWPWRLTARACRRSSARSLEMTRSSSSVEAHLTPRGFRSDWKAGGRPEPRTSKGCEMKRIVWRIRRARHSVAVRWLAEKYEAEIIAVTLDLGQGQELTNVRERALALGAIRAHVIDAREEFARDYVLPALQARAIYEDGYPLASSLARPLIAKHLVAIARMEGASAVAHGCTAKDNDQVGLDISVRALDPSLELIAPAREWNMSRSDEIEYARVRNIPVPVTIASPYSVDSNLWGRSIECGVLEDAWEEPPADIYTLTRPPHQCPDEPAYIEIDFDRGVLCARTESTWRWWSSSSRSKRSPGRTELDAST
jgi:hypothetical protein